MMFIRRTKTKEFQPAKQATSKSVRIQIYKDAKYKATYENNEIVLIANKAGLISLGNNLIALANSEKESDHFHYDPGNPMTMNSEPVIFCKDEDAESYL